MLHRLAPIFIASLTFAACTVGQVDTTGGGDTGGGDVGDTGGGGDDNGDTAGSPDAAPLVQEYAMLVSPALGDINLGDQLSFTATLSSENFSGPVTLDLAGAMPSWEVLYSPGQTVQLLENETIDVVVTVTVPTNAEAASAPLSFTLDGELGERNASAVLNVANQVVIPIPQGSGQGAHNINNNITVRQGASVVFLNEDSINHRIHAGDHQDDELSTGQSYTLTYNGPGNDTAYCHIHGENTGIVQVTIE